MFLILCSYYTAQIIHNLRQYFTSLKSESHHQDGSKQQQRLRRTAITRVAEAVRAVALCHNVTPVFEGDDDDASSAEADRENRGAVTYQVGNNQGVSGPVNRSKK